MHNILDKTDKSLAVKPPAGGDPLPKRVQYRWATDGARGRFRQIDKHDLNIDGRYQRENVSTAKIVDIAKNWDWLMFGTVSVVERGDGSLWVFDGGQRTRASFRRDDINKLPCMVHKAASVIDEAKAFYVCGTRITTISSYDRHRAALCAEEPIAIRTQKVLDDLGLVLKKDGAVAGEVRCISTLRRAVEEDEVTARRAMEFCKGLPIDESIDGAVFNGLFRLCRHFAPKINILAKYGERIARHSQKELLIRLRQHRAEIGKGGAVVDAKGLLRVASTRSRNKLKW